MKNSLLKAKAAAYMLACSVVFVSCDKDDVSNGAMKEEPKSDLYTSSNSSGSISVFNVLSPSAVSANTLSVSGADADGIYYDQAADRIIQFDRSNKKLNAYNNASSLTGTIIPSFSIDVAAANGREISVNNNTVVLASSSDSALFVFNVGDNAFTLEKSHKIGFESWGIQLVGNTLYAVVDKTSDLAVFNNYTAMASGDITPSKRFTVEGIVRTHGLHFVESKDMMIMTDVADAASDSDGAVHVISGFTNKMVATSNGGTLALSDQVRISGPNTSLGNPVDVAYDLNNDIIYVAERKTQGGLLLGFDLPTSNNMDMPRYTEVVAGVSAVYMNN